MSTFEAWIDEVLKHETLTAKPKRPAVAPKPMPRRQEESEERRPVHLCSIVRGRRDSITINYQVDRGMFMKYHLLWDRIRPEDRFDAKDRLIVYCTDRIGVDHLALARGRKVEGYSLSFPANFYSAPEGVAFIFKTNFMRLKLDLHDPTALESLHAELDERARRWREQPRARLLPAPVRPVVESQRIERLAA